MKAAGVGAWWPLLDRALARGRDAGLSRDALEAQVDAGRAQLWPGERSVMVTSLHDTDEGGCIHVWLAAGDLAELLSMGPGIEAWARAQGCQFASIDGRPGWGRALRRKGFTRVGDELLRRL
jgi:hypothetical protein